MPALNTHLYHFIPVPQGINVLDKMFQIYVSGAAVAPAQSGACILMQTALRLCAARAFTCEPAHRAVCVL